MNLIQRNPRRYLWLALLLAAIAITYPLWSPYFINDVVDEAFPSLESAERDAVRAMPEAQRETLLAMSEDQPEMAADTARAMMAEDTAMDEAMPVASAGVDTDDEAQEATPLRSGDWIEIDPIHRAEGSATLWQLGEQRILRFEDFRVTNGPRLHVYLSQNAPTGIFDDVEGFIDLGPLKGNIGNQNYEIPADLDLSAYRSAVIYCVPFGVVFSSAELLPAE
ncbi:MAG: DM13 domain-containing protein [Chloroflexi bacterium]|nr:DM13 domain-containing protein [Chloroflexota bacterium]